MKKLFISLCLMSFMLLVGCDKIGIDLSGRYTGGKDAVGNFLILDTKTGNVKVLKNEQLVNIPKEKDIENVKTYPSRNIPGMPIEIGGMRLKFRDGYLLYQGYMQPIIKAPNEGEAISAEAQSELFDRMEALWEVKYGSGQINIKFSDTDGFDILSLKITRGGMTRTIDNNSNPIRLSFEGSRQISPKAFKAISGYNFSWILADWEATSAKEKKNG